MPQALSYGILPASLWRVRCWLCPAVIQAICKCGPAINASDGSPVFVGLDFFNCTGLLGACFCS